MQPVIRSSFRAGRTWSRRDNPRSRRSAAFWTRCKGAIVENGRPKSTLLDASNQYESNDTKQERPAIADKPARRESLPKLLQFDVPTTLSLTIVAYLHAFNCYYVRNPRNPEKFTENSNLWSSRSSKVIDLGANRKPICDLLLVTNSNFSRICYRFRDIHG